MHQPKSMCFSIFLLAQRQWVFESRCRDSRRRGNFDGRRRESWRREREREREGFYPPFVAQPQYYGFFLFFSLSSGKLSQWTTMTKESSFVAVIHCDEGKFICHSGPVQRRKNPSTRWIPATKENSNVTMSHCGKGILFVAVNQCNEGKLLCNSEPLWQKIFFFCRGEPQQQRKIPNKSNLCHKMGIKA